MILKQTSLAIGVGLFQAPGQRTGIGHQHWVSMGPAQHSNEAESPVAAAKPGVFPRICGDFNMRIARDGTWFYQGTPINRHALVKLFSTVLNRHDDGSFWLTTPVESGRIEVEDAPFIAVELLTENPGPNQVLKLRTNVDDVVTLDADHPLRIAESSEGEPRPYVMVRKGLEARIARAVFYHLVEVAEPDAASPDVVGVRSSGQFFALGHS